MIEIQGQLSPWGVPYCIDCAEKQSLTNGPQSPDTDIDIKPKKSQKVERKNSKKVKPNKSQKVERKKSKKVDPKKSKKVEPKKSKNCKSKKAKVFKKPASR